MKQSSLCLTPHTLTQRRTKVCETLVFLPGGCVEAPLAPQCLPTGLTTEVHCKIHFMARDTEPLSSPLRVLQPVTTSFHGTSASAHSLGDPAWTPCCRGGGGEIRGRSVDPFHSASHESRFMSVPEAITLDRLASVGCGGSQGRLGSPLRAYLPHEGRVCTPHPFPCPPVLPP